MVLLTSGAQLQRQATDVVWCHAQYPSTGYFTFELAPYNVTIGEAGIVVDAAQGVGTSTIVKNPKEDGIYGIPPPGQYTGADRVLSETYMFSAPSRTPRRTASTASLPRASTWVRGRVLL